MKQLLKNQRFRAWIAFLCVFVMACSTFPIAASDVSSLEQQENQLSNELGDLKTQLSTLSQEITALIEQTEQTAKDCEIAEFNVAAAKINEEHQYAAMEKRIQFMYENGSTTLMEIILTAESMADFLNKTQYASSITDYDRNMLDELMAIHEDIAQKEQTLKDELEKLTLEQEELQAKEVTLNETIESTSNRLDATSAELQEARRAQEAARIALEQQRAAEAAAAQAAAQAAAADAAPSEDTAGENTSGDPSANGQTADGTTPAPTPTPAPPTPAPTPSTPAPPPVSANANEVALFAGLLQAEAGSTNYDALLAVATVVMNRLESSRYAPTTIRGIIYQSGQFSPTWNGSLDRILANGPAPLCYQVAQDAMGGARLAKVAHCYSFRAASGGRQGINVGGNVFF